MKRLFLFLSVNLLITITLMTLASVLGVGRYMTAAGIDYKALAGFCLLWGMGGSFISLLLSKTIAKFTMRVKTVDPERPGQFSWLVRRTHDLARTAGLSGMPEVGVFENPSPNAFATGRSQNSSLVAVSTGLLNSMSEKEIEAVIAHEIAHIKNGDMITLTLIQGVLNAFTMFLARIIGFAISQAMRSSDDRDNSPTMMTHLIVMVLDIVLGLLSMTVICWFSRKREFRADAGSAKILGSTAPMIAALKSLGAGRGIPQLESGQEAMAAFQISGKSGGFASFFATHPSLEDRIAALEAAR